MIAAAPSRRAWWRPRVDRGGGLRALPDLLLLVPFLLWPLAAIVWRSLAPDGELSGSAIADVAGDRFYWERLAFTTAQALASTALAVAIGLPAAYVFAQFRFPGRGLARVMLTVPFVLPTLVVALAFQQFVGPEGWLNDVLGWFGLGPVEAMGTIWVILAAHVFYNVAIVVRLVSGVWANLDPETEEAARLLGAGRLATLRSVTLPALGPAIASAAALVFVFTFTSFGVVLVLGGPDLETLEVVIFRLAVRLIELPAAAVLSLVQIATTLVVLSGYAVVQRRTARPLARRPERARPLREATSGERGLVAAVALVLGLLVLAPLAALVHAALTVGASGGVTAANFQRLFEDTGRVSFIEPLQALRWSLTFAVGAAAIAVVVGTLAATAIARAGAGGRGCGRAADAAVARAGGGARLRLPDHVQRALVRSPRLPLADRHRPRADRLPLRGAGCARGAAHARPAPARGGASSSARRRSRSGVTSSCRWRGGH